MTDRITELTQELMNTTELSDHRLSRIRERQAAIEHLTEGVRHVEPTNDAEHAVVAHHPDEGRTVLATAPAGAEDLAEHLLHAQEDIAALLHEINRLNLIEELHKEHAKAHQDRELQRIKTQNEAMKEQHKKLGWLP